MSFDFNYGKKTGVTTFKKRVAEICKILQAYELHVRAWVQASTLPAPDKVAILSIIDAVDAGCAAVKALPDD